MNQNNIAINPRTAVAMDGFAIKPSHALILLATHINYANHLAGVIAKKSLNNTKNWQNQIIDVKPAESKLGIEDIRNLRSKLRYKSESTGKLSTVVIISSLDILENEAQNALLKLLEEPPTGVLLILLATNSFSILPTISSRCSLIEALPISLDQAASHYAHIKANIDYEYTISDGDPYKLELLLSNDKEVTAELDSINFAKELLSQNAYQKLQKIEAIYKQKDQIYRLMNDIKLICKAAARKSKNKKPWVHNTKLVLESMRLLDSNVQAKLVLDNLMLNLR